MSVLIEHLWVFIPALITLALGLITALLHSLSAQEREADLQKPNDIAQAASAKAEEHRARALEHLVERLPPTADLVEFQAAIENLIATLGKSGGLSRRALREKVEDLVHRYQKQALDQAGFQFWFSVAAATVGFALIIVLVIPAAGRSLVDVPFNTVPGAVVEVVAALFFKQASETRERATKLYDRLRADSQRRRALELVSRIEDRLIRSAVKAQLAFHLAGLPTTPLDTTALLLKWQENTADQEDANLGLRPLPRPDTEAPR